MRVGILQFVAQLLEVSGEREREGLVGGKALLWAAVTGMRGRRRSSKRWC
jgi:hypothetical protein